MTTEIKERTVQGVLKEAKRIVKAGWTQSVMCHDGKHCLLGAIFVQFGDYYTSPFSWRKFAEQDPLMLESVEYLSRYVASDASEATIRIVSFNDRTQVWPEVVPERILIVLDAAIASLDTNGTKETA